MSGTSNARNKIGAATIGLGVVAAGLLASPAPAAAATDRVQVFKDVNFGGGSAWIELNDSRYSDNWFSDGSNVNDQVSSIKNDTDWGICFFKHNDDYILLFAMAPHTTKSWVGSSNNDTISSSSTCNDY